MEENQRKEIQEIVNHYKCPRDFRCSKSHFKTLCKAKDIGLESFLECPEKGARSCPVSIPFGDAHFCQCPLRVYVAKKLKK